MQLLKERYEPPVGRAGFIAAKLGGSSAVASLLKEYREHGGDTAHFFQAIDTRLQTQHGDKRIAHSRLKSLHLLVNPRSGYEFSSVRLRASFRAFFSPALPEFGLVLQICSAFRNTSSKA